MIQIKSGIHQLVCAPDYSRLHDGFAAGGPQDRFSCRMANKILGNDPYAGAIEFTLAPAAFHVSQNCHLLVGGGESEISVDGQVKPDWTVLAIAAGSNVRIKIGQAGCRVYVCVAGGLLPDSLSLDLPATDLPASNLLAAGDALSSQPGLSRPGGGFQWEPKLGTVRALPGPEATGDAIAQLTGQHWEVSPQSSAMGVRLRGEALRIPRFDILSSPVQDGTVQATANGLIALLRQRGTLGGYPRVATIIDCDVDRLAQFRPGSRLRFEIVERAEAEKAVADQAERLTDASLPGHQ